MKLTPDTFNSSSEGKGKSFPSQVMKDQRGIECWACKLTLAFGTTRTAELSAVRAGHTLTPPPLYWTRTNFNFPRILPAIEPGTFRLMAQCLNQLWYPSPLLFYFKQTNKSRTTTRTWYCNYLALISSVQRVGYSCDCCLNLCWSSSIRCTQTAAYRQGYCRSIFWFPVFCPETGICRTGTRPLNRDT